MTPNESYEKLRQVEMLKMEGFFFKQTDANWECLVNFALSHKVFCRW